jgi:hypothetical protein
MRSKPVNAPDAGDAQTKHAEKCERGAPGRVCEKPFGDEGADEKCDIRRELVNADRFTPMRPVDQRRDRGDGRRHIKPRGKSKTEESKTNRPQARRRSDCEQRTTDARTGDQDRAPMGSA